MKYSESNFKKLISGCDKMGVVKFPYNFRPPPLYNAASAPEEYCRNFIRDPIISLHLVLTGLYDTYYK